MERGLAYREIQESIRLGIGARPTGRYGRMYSIVEPSAPEQVPDHLVAILGVLSAQGYVTNKDLREAWGVSRFVAWKQVARLVEEGFLHQKGEKKGRRYYPAERLRAVLSRRD